MLKYKIYVFLFFIIGVLSINIAYASENNLELLGKVIYLDAGHGGIDSGATYKNIKEKDINLAISLKLEEELTNKTTNNMEERIIKFDLSKYRANSARYEVRNKKGNKMTILIDDLPDERYKIVARNEETSEILHYNEKGRLFNTIESVNDLDLVEKNINKDKKKYYVVILKPLIPMPTEKNTSYISYMFSSKEEAQTAEGDSYIFKYIKTVEVEIDE